MIRYLDPNTKEAQEFYKRIEDPFALINSDWEYVYINEAAAKLFNRQDTELLNKDFKKVQPELIKTTFFKNYKEALENKTNTQFDYYFSELKEHYNIHVYPSRWGIAIYFHNITEKINREKELNQHNIELEQQKQRMNDLVEYIPGVVWETWGQPNSKKQTMNYVSYHVEEMLGYSVNEWLDEPNFWLTIVHPEDKEKAVATALKTFESGKEGANRFRWIKKDGKAIWVETRSTAIYDNKGKPVGMRGVTMNIEERVALEKRKDEFISLASHELKTPLTTIKAYTQYAQEFLKKKDIEKASESVEKACTQIERLTRLINDLLNVSKIQAGKFDYDMKPIDICALVKDITTDFQNTIKTHNIVLKNNVVAKVKGDKNRLVQVINNLLTNAVKYSPKAKDVSVHMHKDKDSVVISVQDFGHGISSKNKEKIFQRFYRIQAENQKTIQGLGLGLYISNEIIKAHNGSISVISELGKGSTFSLTLPLI